MSQHIGPRTISAQGGSIKRVGNYRIHTFPSELVTDGLVLNLDAGDPRSYPGSGATWTDLTGNGNNGTLNGPTYSNADGGRLAFNGTSDYITLPSNSSIRPSQVTIEAWAYHTNASQSVSFIGGYGNTGTEGYWIGKAGSNWGFSIGTGSSYYQLAGFTYSSNTIVHLVGTFDGSVMKFYTNGVLSTSYGLSGNISYSGVSPYIGQADGLSSDRYWTGNIFNFKVYNRSLSAAEIAQNYDALKVRYTSYTNTFTPLCGGGEGKVEVLCVAGGGGGAVGGGGAGGLVYNSAFSVNSNSGIGVTVGYGGIGAAAWGSNGTNGSNTTFSSITSIAGGYGSHGGDGASGGSGGGGGYSSTVNASGTSGQGNAGGKGGSGAPNYPGGGGGGAGSVGADGVGTATAGNGGSGLAYSISGTSQFYAGGGAGATQGGGTAGIGGSGVGGNGNINSFGLNGIPNTGSAGGGSGQNFGGGNGSNGIIIVRYPASDYNVELLIVGGGGSGAQGGGGAGGLIYYSSYPVSAGTKYSVIVGAGGTSATNITNGNNGQNSSFSSLLVAYGGGGGGKFSNSSQNAGFSGGSGGGGGGSDDGNPAGIGGSGISGQGNSGGNGSSVNTVNATGGGGGAGGVGLNANSSTPGNGGVGLAFSITGMSSYYAGGGGGGGSTSGSGGLGGGGNGGTTNNPGFSAVANTGGGGGGGGNATSGLSSGAGGSGIIIIAYKGPQRGIGGTVDTTSRPGYTLHKFTTTGTDFFIP